MSRTALEKRTASDSLLASARSLAERLTVHYSKNRKSPFEILSVGSYPRATSTALFSEEPGTAPQYRTGNGLVLVPAPIPQKSARKAWPLVDRFFTTFASSFRIRFAAMTRATRSTTGSGFPRRPSTTPWLCARLPVFLGISSKEPFITPTQ